MLAVTNGYSASGECLKLAGFPFTPPHFFPHSYGYLVLARDTLLVSDLLLGPWPKLSIFLPPLIRLCSQHRPRGEKQNMGDVQNEFYWLNITSLVCAIIMMAMVLFLRYSQPSVANTISLKLSLWIGLVDALSRALFLLRISYHVMDAITPSRPWLARLLLYTVYAFPIWFAFLTVSIAFDLHLSFLCRRKNMKKIQSWYFPVATLASFSLALPIPFVGDSFWDKNSHAIFTYVDATTSYLIEIFCFDIWMISSILYSFGIILAVICRVLTSLRVVRENLRSISAEMEDREKQLILSVLRILLYPTVLVVCQPASLVLNWLFLTNQPLTELGLRTQRAEAITTGMQGLLNLIVFLLNPAVVRALSRYKLFKILKSASGSSEATDEFPYDTMSRDP
ncbi:uncharacterized protein VTP21DRAFT_6128 [Calcarisporiella thermophila]|uniref:uncharacterized protein n=1 Tax=Calcarisporiella thermophila TaxID=911321 RepID=UPI003744754E